MQAVPYCTFRHACFVVNTGVFIYIIFMFSQRKNVILIGFVIAALFCIPFYNTSIFAGLDLTFHLSRIDGMLTALKDLQFPLAVYPEKNFGFGYASPLFYCDFFLFPAALLYAMHIPIIIVYKIYVFLIAWIGACTALYAMNEYTSHPGLCAVGAVIFTFSSYRINDFFIRAALGEALAFAVLPLFMVYVKRYLADGENNTLPLALFFSALALSHLITFALTAAVFAVLLVIYSRKLFKRKQILTFFKAVVIGAALCAFFLLPLLQQLRSQTFLFSQNRELWGEEIMRSYSNTLLSAVSDYLFMKHYDLELHHYFTGLIVVLSPAVFLFSKKKDEVHRFLAILCVISVILLIATTDLLPLYKIKALQSIQFTYRFNILIATFLPFALIYTVDQMASGARKTVMAVLLVYTAANTAVIDRQLLTDEIQISNTASNYALFHREFYENYNNYFNVSELSSGEYLPATHQINYKYLSGSIDLYDTSSPSVSYERTGTKSLLTMNCESDGFAGLPVTWYLGYQAELADGDEPVILPISQDEYTGRIVIPVYQGEHTYRVYYKGTTVQRLSLALSLVSLLVLAGYLLAENARRNAAGNETVSD